MASIVITWTVWESTGSPLMVALSMLSSTVPQILFSFGAGIAADRYSHRRIMMLSDAARMLVTMAAAFLVWSGEIESWHWLALNFLLFTAGSFFGPARAAAIPRLVHSSDLQAANGLMTASFHTALLVGPLVGGVLLRWFDAGTLLLVDSLTFGASMLGLLAVPHTVSDSRAERPGLMGSVREAVGTLRATPSLLWVVGTFGVGTLLAGGVSQVGKTLLVDRAGAGAAGLGLLSFAIGVGIMVGSLLVGRFRSHHRARLVFLGWLGAGAVMLLYALPPSLWLLVLAALLSGLDTALINVPTGALIQQYGGNSTGRVFSYWTINIWVGESLSLALAAPLFALWPLPAVFGGAGLLLSLLALFALRRVWALVD